MKKKDIVTDIIMVINNYVQEFSKSYWKNDECKPRFIVSLNNEEIENQSILITITHCNVSFTETLFPRNDRHYGYESIHLQMINMYNQTM